MPRAVIDTNVLFEGLTRVGPCCAVVDAWVAMEFTPCVSTALALEYEEVLTKTLGPLKRQQGRGALRALLKSADWVPFYRRVRPVSGDPDDDFVLECAFNGRAGVVTRNLKDLKVGEAVLGLSVWTPEQFIAELRSKSMARVTLRLPDSLHKRLAAQAEAEGVSMNQYLVYALAQVSTAADMASQKAKFRELLEGVPDEDAEADLQTLLRGRAS